MGGAIASDIHGKFRHGSFADSVTRLTLATPERGALTLEPSEDAFWATAGGMGLTGLIVRAVVQAHGGTLRVDTALGEGMTVEVSLPRAAPVPE